MWPDLIRKAKEGGLNTTGIQNFGLKIELDEMKLVHISLLHMIIMQLLINMVSAQTSVYVKKPNKAEDEPTCMKWEWRPESIESTVVQGKGDFSINKIVDQNDMANDARDYFWLMVSFELGKDDHMVKVPVSFRFNNSGQVSHVFLSGAYIGSQWPTTGCVPYIFEKNIKLSIGKSLIPFLSVTVGLGKGIAWVNGHNMGWFWPSAIADEDMCKPGTCDYRGQ
ncbi:hypothetical protein GOBAR_AA19205 [Gossypium barbadense]|uniref:Beta-galactosidase galactose-binding domain-containing protein n=1 Tax=Gossypium barbadense TaxID=3634 RepID=A0A2P5XDM8_GOSBA|nr:hypothetical protein GOBAR_AA19205 [Gossypium barbadense]